jgi:hypothetical protein
LQAWKPLSQAKPQVPLAQVGVAWAGAVQQPPPQQIPPAPQLVVAGSLACVQVCVVGSHASVVQGLSSPQSASAVQQPAMGARPHVAPSQVAGLQRDDGQGEQEAPQVATS